MVDESVMSGDASASVVGPPNVTVSATGLNRSEDGGTAVISEGSIELIYEGSIDVISEKMVEDTREAEIESKFSSFDSRLVDMERRIDKVLARLGVD
jgi:hypothetical protein